VSFSKLWAEVVGGKNPKWLPSATLKTTYFHRLADIAV